MGFITLKVLVVFQESKLEDICGVLGPHWVILNCVLQGGELINSGSVYDIGLIY